MKEKAYHLKNWDEIRVALNSSQILFWLWYVKHIGRFYGMAKMMHIMEFWKTNLWPFHKTDTEDTLYLLKCNNLDM